MNYKLPKLEREDKKTLEKNMSHLDTSANSNYCLPILQTEKIKLWTIYEKYINSNSPSINCPRCVLRVCKSLYYLYVNMTENERNKH